MAEIEVFVLSNCYKPNVSPPPPPNSYIEALIPKVMVFEIGALGRELGLDKVMRGKPSGWG